VPAVDGEQRSRDVAGTITAEVQSGLGEPEKEIGALAVFLATPGGHYITGDTFNIDGGRVLRP